MTTPTTQDTHGDAVRSLTTEAIERARAEGRTALIGYLRPAIPPWRHRSRQPWNWVATGPT